MFLCFVSISIGLIPKIDSKSDFKVVKSMYDKFKQINKFIEIIDQSCGQYNKENITILDFGCGKSYLTFLVYHFFVNIKKINAKIIGYDIKKQVVEDCNNIVKKYIGKLQKISKNNIANTNIILAIATLKGIIL